MHAVVNIYSWWAGTLTSMGAHEAVAPILAALLVGLALFALEQVLHAMGAGAGTNGYRNGR